MFPDELFDRLVMVHRVSVTCFTPRSFSNVVDFTWITREGACELPLGAIFVTEQAKERPGRGAINGGLDRFMSFDGVLKELASDLGSGFDFDLTQPFGIVVVKLFVVFVDGVELGLVLVERVDGFEEVFSCRILG